MGCYLIGVDRRAAACVIASVLVASCASAPDSATVEPSVQSFKYSWQTKTAEGFVTGTFAIDRNCTLSSGGPLGASSEFYGYDHTYYSGTVPPAECAAFKSLLLSHAVINGLATPHAGSCPDDFPMATLALVDGTTIRQGHPQCAGYEPYKTTLIPRMRALREMLRPAP